MLSNKQIALVHVACKELGIGEDDRHRIQAEVGGSPSLTRMSYAGWKRMITYLEGKGFKSLKFKVESSKFNPEPGTRNSEPRTSLIKKIYVLWWQLAGTYYRSGAERLALRGFLRKRFRVDHENFLTPAQAVKVIEAIKAIQGRRLKVDRLKTEGRS